MTNARDDLTKKLTEQAGEDTQADVTTTSDDDESVEGHAVNYRPLDNGPGRRPQL